MDARVEALQRNIREVGRDISVAKFPTHAGPFERDHTIPSHEGQSGIFLGIRLPDGRRGMLKLHSATDEARSQLEHEATILSKVSQRTDYVPQVFERVDIELDVTGEKKLYPGLVMEYMEGRKLSDSIAGRHEPLGVPVVTSILASVAEAVDVTHEEGYVHLDIKPSNIIRITGTNEGALIDFDGAKRIGEKMGTSLGSKGFMGPEHVKPGTEFNAAMDIWQMGAVAYNALTGRTVMPEHVLNPELHHNQKAYEEHIRNQLLELPESIRPVFLKVLAYDPQMRYDTATEFVNALKHAYDGRDALEYVGRHRIEKVHLGKRIKEYITPKIIRLMRNRPSGLSEIAAVSLDTPGPDDTLNSELKALTQEREYAAEDIEGIRVDGLPLYNSQASREHFNTADPTLCIIESDEDDPLRWAVFVHQNSGTEQPELRFLNIPTNIIGEITLQPDTGESIVQGEGAKVLGGPRSPYANSQLRVDDEGIFHVSFSGEMGYTITANPEAVVLPNAQEDLVGAE